MGRRSMLAALAVAASGVVAGAAGAAHDALSPKQYKARLVTLGQESNRSQALISNGLKAKSVPKLVAALDQFAAAEDHVATEVAALHPPANAVAANQQLAKGLHDIATAVRKVAAKVKGVKTVAQATALLNKDTSGVAAGREVNAALSKLGKLGYG